MKALILGAGYGVRLYPLTKNTPKPLLNIAGKSVIEWTLDLLSSAKDVSEVFIVVNRRFYESYQNWLPEVQQRFKKKITLVDDETTTNDNKLGAIGDIQFVVDKCGIKGDLLVIAGDNLFGDNIDEIISYYKKHGPTIALKNMKDVDRKLISQYSVVTLDKSDKVIDFEEKPPDPKSILIAICLYVFPARDLGLFKEYLDGHLNPDAPGYYIQWLHKKRDVFGYVMKNHWFDIGDIDSYKEANDFYMKSQEKGKGKKRI
ncbi:MAG: nucleotidyltransferase family protein [Planctomycetota bacterium]